MRARLVSFTLRATWLGDRGLLIVGFFSSKSRFHSQATPAVFCSGTLRCTPVSPVYWGLRGVAGVPCACALLAAGCWLLWWLVAEVGSVVLMLGSR